MSQALFQRFYCWTVLVLVLRDLLGEEEELRLSSENSLTAGICRLTHSPVLSSMFLSWIDFLAGIMPKYDRVLIVGDLLSL